MIYKNFLAAVFAVASMTTTASAVPIGIGDFDGTETLIDFSSAATGSFSGSYVEGDLSITSNTNSYLIQSAGGFGIGGSGPAFNTFGNSSADNGATLAFASDIVKFGMVFGASRSSNNGLIATVAAFDGLGGLVESQTFTAFNNSFVGFAFDTAVASVVITRDPSEAAPGRYTFIDDVRFTTQAATPVVPLPAGGVLLIGGLAALAAVRRRQT